MNELAEIEAIKQLKARYFRYLDTKQWDAWGNIFTEDAILINRVTRPEPLRGRARIVGLVSENLQDCITVHHGHMPEIRIIGPQAAEGIWAMFDIVTGPSTLAGAQGFKGYGHYIEKYRKEADGAWRIERLELRRLHLRRFVAERSDDVAQFDW